MQSGGSLRDPTPTRTVTTTPPAVGPVSNLIINAGINHKLLQLIADYVAECNEGMKCMWNGMRVEKEGKVDLIIAEIPDNKPVKGVSANAPKWNVLIPTWLKNVFAFANKFLHDDAAMYLIYSDDSGATEELFRGYFRQLGFRILRNFTE